MNYRPLTRNIAFCLVFALCIAGAAACDSRGDSASGSENEAPNASFSYAPQSPQANGQVSFTDESTDADGQIGVYRWEFGDGSVSTEASPSHVYTDAGSYEVTLIVTDNGGDTGSASETIEVSEGNDGGGGGGAQQYQNPVVNPVAADPSTIRGPDGTYYLYATQDAWANGDGFHFIPMFESEDLVSWEFVGDAFSGIPSWGPGYTGRYLWAPDVSKREDTYYMYYSYVQDGQPPCIGLATSSAPDGPWEDMGEPVFCSEEIGVDNSIDPFVWNEGDTPTMIWGSFAGIYAVELSEDGTAPVSEPTLVADTRFEAPYVRQHGDYYYLFLSPGTCCDGANSTYDVFVGRSESLTGPYVGPGGTDLRYGGGQLILSEGNGWVGPGHNSVATDDAGNDWMVYHAIPDDNPRLSNGINNRPGLIDRITWENGWPVVNGGNGPSASPQPAPVIEED